MISPRLRLSALVLLIFSLALFTGIAVTASALVRPGAVDACCDRGEHEQKPSENPCTDAHCLCFSCLALELATPLPYGRALVIVESDLCLSSGFHADGFATAIDYPPEIA